MQRVDTFTIELGLGYLDSPYRPNVLAQAGLVGYWPMWEYRGADAFDQSGGGNHGRYTNGPTLGVMGMLAEGGTSARFDSTDSYVEVGPASTFAFTGAFSVECWIRMTSVDASHQRVIAGRSRWVVDGAGWTLYVLNGCVGFYAATSAGVQVFRADTAVSCADGLPHHVLAVWNGTTGANGVKIYVDGALAVQATAVAGTIASLNYPFRIGSNSDGPTAIYTFSWDISDVAVYNVAVPFPDIIKHAALGAWTALSQRDVIGALGSRIEYGIAGNGPLDRLAGSGTFEFVLRNDVGNSGGLLGYYSPNSRNCRAFFGFGIPVRARFTTGSITYTRFWGTLEVIEPTAGRNKAERAYCHCVAHDFMYRLGQSDLREITAQVNEMEDSLIYAVLEALPENVRPMAVDIDAGLDTYPYAFFDLGDGVKAATALNKVIVSAWGKGYVSGDGTFCYRNRQTEALRTLSHEFDNDMVGLEVPSTRDQVYDRIRVTTHQRTLGTTDTEALYDLPSPVEFQPGETKEIFGSYADPANKQSLIGAVDVHLPSMAGVRARLS